MDKIEEELLKRHETKLILFNYILDVLSKGDEFPKKIPLSEIRSKISLENSRLLGSFTKICHLFKWSYIILDDTEFNPVLVLQKPTLKQLSLTFNELFFGFGD
jgi:hypothetical protein